MEGGLRLTSTSTGGGRKLTTTIIRLSRIHGTVWKSELVSLSKQGDEDSIDDIVLVFGI
jgi:hypothetical protein